MLKVKEEKLINKDGLYYFDNVLFNGIVYFTNDVSVDAVKVCNKGQLAGNYLNKFIDYKQYELHLCGERLDDDEIEVVDKDGIYILDPEEQIDYSLKYYYQKKPFTGIFYGFKDGILEEESICIDGVMFDDLYDKTRYCVRERYHPNGDIQLLSVSNGFCEQEYSFNRKREIEKFMVYIHKHPLTNKEVELMAEMSWDENKDLYGI